MEFSSISFCAKDKMAIDFHTYPLLCRAMIHQSGMGIDKSGDSPFVELTSHKPLLHSSFEMSKLNETKQFVLTEKTHNYTNNTRNFVRSESILQRKEIYSNKFPVMALSQLVGGFVGSKSQIGSCGRESCQIWDIIFDKLVEFCRTSQAGCYSLYAKENAQNCYNLENNLCQGIFGSLCHESVSTLHGSHLIIESISNPLQEKVNDTFPQHSTLSCNTFPVSVKSTSPQYGDELYVSRQSYAEVAKAFAIAEQSKQQCTRTLAKTRKNIPCCGDFRSNMKHLSWGCCHKSPVKNYGNEHVLAVSCRRTRQYSKGRSMHKVGKSKANSKHISISDSEKKTYEAKRDFQTTVSKELYRDCSWVTNKSTIVRNSNCMRNVEGKSAKPCPTIKCSSPADDCTAFTNKSEGGSSSAVLEASEFVQTLPTNVEHQCSGQSPARERYLSDCSTDSDDSFVSFERGVDLSPRTVALVLQSEPSEDGASDQFSDEDEDDDGGDYDDDDDESDDTEIVAGLKEVNARWYRDYSEYSGCEKNPVKVHFACDTSLETVHPLITWNYAYRAARCGPWVRMAGDRERFMARIRRMEPLLAAVLSAEHRHHIWCERMAQHTPVLV